MEIKQYAQVHRACNKNHGNNSRAPFLPFKHLLPFPFLLLLPLPVSFTLQLSCQRQPLSSVRSVL